LHADSMPNYAVRGLSVYTLSERASDAEAAALAERENKVDLIGGIKLAGETPEVTNILIDLIQRETMNESARFASLLVDELQQGTTLLPRTHRFAGFAVLKAPDVPSVLIELGYLSNDTDERLLRSSEYRQRLAQGIARAIDRYFIRLEARNRH
jgi:N-acetylmuramoyl-L-alanine amidase